jgi:hypothetical protein
MAARRVLLLHIVDARVGDQKVEGAEIIGLDTSRASYITQYFGSDGATAYEATLGEEGRPSRGRCAARPPDSPAASVPTANTIAGIGIYWTKVRAGGRGWTSTLAKQAGDSPRRH